MNEFWILIFVTFFVTNSLDKAESVQLEEKPLKIIDEIFGEGWWDSDKAEEWHKLTLEPNFHHQINQQNTQLGQIEPNSTDQLGQIEPNSTDQIPPLTESDHSAMKTELKLDAFKSLYKEIDDVAKKLGINFATIYRWKCELGQTTQHKHSYSEQKELMKLYYEIKDKNPKINNENIAKMFKIGTTTLNRWKKQFKRQQFHPNSVDGHSGKENISQINVQEIENSNSEMPGLFKENNFPN